MFLFPIRFFVFQGALSPYRRYVLLLVALFFWLLLGLHASRYSSCACPAPHGVPRMNLLPEDISYGMRYSVVGVLYGTYLSGN